MKNTALLAALVAAATFAQAQGSLQDARLGVIKGTTKGITLIDAPGARPPEPAASAVAGAPAASGWGAPAQAGAAPQTQAEPARAGSGSSWLQPPVGVPLSAARQGEAPGLNLVMPSSASQPGGKAK